MKKQLKKTVSLGLAAVMALGLTACGGGSSSSDSTTAAAGSGESKTEAAADSGNSGDVKVIKLFHRFPDDPCNSFIESKLAEYESLHPDIKFEVTSAQNQPYKEKIKVVVGSDECPDIFFSFCGEFSERFIREGLLLDKNPNQLGLECGAASGRMSLSVQSANAAFNLAKLWRRRSTKDGNLSNWAHPIAACMSVAFKLYPRWEYTYLWSYPSGSSPY